MTRSFNTIGRQSSRNHIQLSRRDEMLEYLEDQQERAEQRALIKSRKAHRKAGSDEGRW